MLPFSTGILLYLAVSASAAPALQARETDDPSGISSAPTGSAASSAQTSATSARADAPLASSSSTESTPDSTDAALSLLFGANKQPGIADLGYMQGGVEDAGRNKTMFEAAGSVLLALTKCNDKGNWIKSMFGNNSTNKDVANVHIHTIKNDGSTSGFDATVNRSSLTNMISYGFLPDKIEAGRSWWPWALIEAGLQAGWDPKLNGTEDDSNVQDLLKIFTGVNVMSVAPDEELYKNVVDHLQTSPLLPKEKDVPLWSVLMTPSLDDSDPTKIPLAGPYNALFFKMEKAERKPLKELDIAKILYLDGFLTLPEVEKKAKEQRPFCREGGPFGIICGKGL